MASLSWATVNVVKFMVSEDKGISWSKARLGFVRASYTVESMLNIVSLNRDGRATVKFKAPIMIMVISMAMFTLPVASVPPIRGRMREPTLRHRWRNDRGNGSGIGQLALLDRGLQLGFHLAVSDRGDGASYLLSRLAEGVNYRPDVRFDGLSHSRGRASPWGSRAAREVVAWPG